MIGRGVVGPIGSHPRRQPIMMGVMDDALVVADVGVMGPNGWLTRNLSFSLLPGQVLAVVAAASPASIRALLAIAGAVEADEGLTETAQPPGVGWIPRGPSDLAGLTVGTCLAEAAAGGTSLRSRDELAARLHQVGLAEESRRPVADLDQSERVRLGLAMALVSPVGVVVVPELDAGLSDVDAQLLWNLVFSLAGTGVAVVVGCAKADPRASMVLDLWRESS